MSGRGERGALLATLAITAVVYLPGLRGLPLDWDDEVWLVQDPITSAPASDILGLALLASHDGVYAPLLRLSWAAQRALFGDAIWAMHLVSLALFLASVAGIHALIRRLGVGAVPAWVAVTLWALHPTRVECVAWLTGLKDTQSLALLVAMGLALVPAADAPPSARRIAAGTALGVAAMLTKAAVFPIPLALAAAVAARCLGGAAEAARRFGAVVLAGLLLAGVGAAVWHHREWPALSRGLLPLWIHGAWWLRLVPAAPAAIVAVPSPAQAAPIAGIGLALTGTLAATALRWPRAVGPLLALWLLPQLPFLGLVPMAFWASDRHLLVPSLAIAIALALAADRWLRGRPVGVRALPALLAVWGAAVSAGRVSEWHDSRTLWEADLSRPGEHWVRWHKVGVARGRGGDFVGAEDALRRSLVLNPYDTATLAHWAIAALAADGAWTESDAALARHLQPPPETARGWLDAVSALRQSGAPHIAATIEAHLRAMP